MKLFSHPGPLQRYRTDFPDIPGYFQFESMVIWDFFLTAQQRHGTKGSFLEIGVYKGRSALLGALYLRPDEWAVLVDINPMSEPEAAIQKFHTSNNLFLQRRSGDLMAVKQIRESPHSFRWCHVDGDHTGYSTMTDLVIAAQLVSENGIICVDDFFSFRYPQLTASVYRFLESHPFEFRLVFCGANKAYICRAGAYAMYEAEIRNHFLQYIQKHDLKCQLNKTSYASDSGCFSMSWREGDELLVGRDDNPNEMVF